MTITAPGMVMGSVFYISPEQAQGPRTHETSDLYSLGVVLYQMLSGKLPYTGESPVTVALKHVSSPIPSLDADDLSISPALAAIVRKLMQKDPARSLPIRGRSRKGAARSARAPARNRAAGCERERHARDQSAPAYDSQSQAAAVAAIRTGVPAAGRGAAGRSPTNGPRPGSQPGAGSTPPPSSRCRRDRGRLLFANRPNPFGGPSAVALASLVGDTAEEAEKKLDAPVCAGTSLRFRARSRAGPRREAGSGAGPHVPAQTVVTSSTSATGCRRST
jgi:hypothetical protein